MPPQGVQVAANWTKARKMQQAFALVRFGLAAGLVDALEGVCQLCAANDVRGEIIRRP